MVSELELEVLRALDWTQGRTLYEIRMELGQQQHLDVIERVLRFLQSRGLVYSRERRRHYAPRPRQEYFLDLQGLFILASARERAGNILPLG